MENDRNDDVDNMLSYESTKTDQRNGFGFGYSNSSAKFNDGTGEEETKEEQNGNANPMAWTSKFDFFSSKPSFVILFISLLSFLLFAFAIVDD